MGASVGTFGAAEAAIAEAEGLGFDSAAFGAVKTLPPEIAGLDKLRLPDLSFTNGNDIKFSSEVSTTSFSSPSIVRSLTFVL